MPLQVSAVANLALVLELGQREDRLGDGHPRVGAVELVKQNLIEPQPPQAVLARAPQVLRPPVGLPAPGTGAHQAALGRDDQIRGVGIERLGDQVLADGGTVGVSVVDEIDIELHRTAQRCLGRVPVRAGRPRCPAR